MQDRDSALVTATFAQIFTCLYEMKRLRKLGSHHWFLDQPFLFSPAFLPQHIIRAKEKQMFSNHF